MAAAVEVLALLLLVAFTSADSQEDCKLNAAIGQTFNIPLNGLFQKADRLRWMHNSRNIYDSKFTSNKNRVSEKGSLILPSLKKDDEGGYTSEIINSGGGLKSTDTVKLCVHERVPKPKVTFRCDPPAARVQFNCDAGQIKDVKYQWLEGNNSVDHANAPTLLRNTKQLGSNSFSCTVSNRGSSQTSDPVGQTCLQPVSPETDEDNTLFGMDFWVMVGILAGGGGIVLVLIVATIVCCTKNKRKRHLQKKEEQELRLQWSNSNSNQHHHHHRPHQHQTKTHPPHTHRPNQTQAPAAAGHTGPRPQRSRQNRPRAPDPITGQPLPSPRRQTQASGAVEKNDEEMPPPLPQPRKKSPRTQYV